MNDSQFPSENKEQLPEGELNTEITEKVPAENGAEEAEETEETDESAENEEAEEATAEEEPLEESSPENELPPAEKALSFAFDITELFVLSFAIVTVILCFFVRHSPVSGTSMVPTIQNNDTLLVTDFGYTPEQGDVVIVHSLHNLSTPIVKRVIAVGGDTISINFTRWMIEVNGVIYEQRLDEKGNEAQIGGEYVNYEPGMPMYPLGSASALLRIGFTYDANTETYTATVPEGHIFILGDNRLNSKDSRDPSVGFVDERLVVGKAPLRLFPTSSFGTLD